MNYYKKGGGGEGAGRGTPPTQLGGLGERCKLPQRDANAFLLYHAQNTT